jgi:hypothetical protein
MAYFNNHANSYPPAHLAGNYYAYPDLSLIPAKEGPSVQTYKPPAKHWDMVERAIPMIDPRFVTGASVPKNQG